MELGALSFCVCKGPVQSVHSSSFPSLPSPFRSERRRAQGNLFPWCYFKWERTEELGLSAVGMSPWMRERVDQLPCTHSPRARVPCDPHPPHTFPPGPWLVGPISCSRNSHPSRSRARPPPKTLHITFWPHPWLHTAPPVLPVKPR